jgi:rhodanese-related sulfurtransferase
MTMAVCIHPNQLPLAFVAATETEGMAMRLISAQALKEKLDRGDPLKLVNALGAWEYWAARIPGSLHLATPEEILRALNVDGEIVVHCSNPSCGASVALYQLLERGGYRNLRRFAGGLQPWQAAGYSLEGTMVEAQGDAPKTSAAERRRR